MSIIRALKSILTSFIFLDLLLSQLLQNTLPVNANCKAIINNIYAVLPPNIL